MLWTHRRLSLALTTFLIGCTAASNASLAPPVATRSTEPNATASPAPTLPTSLPTSTPMPLVTPGPAGDCPGIDPADLAALQVVLGSVDAEGNGGDIGISLGRVNATMEVTSVTELSGTGCSVAPPAGGQTQERGVLLGGHEFIAFPSTSFEGRVGPQAMLSAMATLTLDGQPPIELATRFVPGNEFFDQVAVTVPDVAGPGTLSLGLVWADQTFRYAASKTIPVDVIPLTATAGCALDARGYYDQLADLLDGSIRVRSTVAHAFSPLNEAKFLPVISPGIDAFIVYAFDRGDPAIVAAPGAVLTIEKASAEINLGSDATINTWTRASVARAIKGYPPHGTVLVLSRTPVKQADGTFRLRVPRDPGRYVAGVTLGYDSQCSSGALWFVVNIDVIAPTPAA